jgi:hypothetical protein
MCVLRHPCRDGSEPWRVSAGRVGPHDAADVAGAVEHVIIIVRPLAARVGFVGLFKDVQARRAISYTAKPPAKPQGLTL